MSLTQTKDDASHIEGKQLASRESLLAYLRSWELYGILLVAAFLRLYQLGTSEFDGDQAAIFGLAREAVQHGLLPLVSNPASIGIQNPPAVIYLLMLPASLSANPLWGVVMVGLLNVIAVFLTYVFIRRYYGRFAGAVAAFLYAAAAKPVGYSRFLWQQNMLAPFVVLFLFALFLGVVERRKGWLFPALLLLGIAYQLHETALFLLIPLLLAIILVPRTIRWRDVGLALLALLVIFSPYIIWEVISKFSDLSVLLQAARQPSQIDNKAISFYQFFLSPNGFTFYYQIPTNPTSLLRVFAPVLAPLRHALLLLTAGGLLLAGALVIWPGRNTSDGTEYGAERQFPLRRWWVDFRANPYRCGLALLLVWQVIPILILSRHSLTLYPYYLLVLMPGPFILIGILLSKIAEWLRQLRGRGIFSLSTLRYGWYALVFLLIAAQVATCTASLLDVVDGSYGHGKTYNTLSSLEQAMHEADQLAQEHHLKRVYVTTDMYSETALRYFAAQMKTPAILFDDSRCLVLPDPAAGPAVMLVSPYAQLALNLLKLYASATLVDRPARLGAPPFQLYIVSPKPPVGATPASGAFAGNLQLIGLQRQQVLPGTQPSLVSRWTMLRSAQPATHTTYSYVLSAAINGRNRAVTRSACTFTAMHAGDELFATFELPANAAVPTSVALNGVFYTTVPNNPWLGPLHLETDQNQTSLKLPLKTDEGTSSIIVKSF